MDSFENFIIKCCEMDEWDLRDFLRDKLRSFGFSTQEDDYRSCRGGKYQQVHNMLCVRQSGSKFPSVCLVAHTDVCRDHGHRSNHKKANPVIKEIDRYGRRCRIVQDEHCQVQVGGDDRLGVAINTWLAINTGYDMGLLFTTDEEIGAISADYMSFPETNEFDILVQVDRGNHSRQLVTNIGGLQICSPAMAKRLIHISETIGLPRSTVIGLLTDVLEIKYNGRCREAVNMTCGYHNSFGASSNEYIDIQEARDTLKYVSEIIKDFDLAKINASSLSVIKENKTSSLFQNKMIN